MSPSARAAKPKASLQVEHVHLIAQDALLLTGTTPAAELPGRVAFVTLSTTAVLEHDALVLERGDRPDGRAWFLVATIPADEGDGGRTASIEIGSGPSAVSVAVPDRSSAVPDLQSLVLHLVTAVPDGARADVLEWLCRFEGRTTSEDPTSLSESLFAVREVLRERLPVCQLLPEARHGLSVDLVLAADERTFYLKGWSRSAGAPLARLTAVSPEGDRSELLPRAFRHVRGDVAEFYAACARPEEDSRYGFIATVRLPAPSGRAAGWVVEAVDADGVGVEALGPAVQDDVAAARQLVLFDAAYELPGEDTLRATHLAPALARLQGRLHGSIGAARIDDYGPQPADPAVTIIVPLYQRLEFVEHQLAQFVHDDEVSANELLYVLDSPTDEAWLRHLATSLFPLYRVPFRTVVMSANGGFAAANNVAASIARGRKLLLVNSDVIPDRPGWVGRMAEFYDETPGIGALGVKLLYEDDSLQHAGLFFKRVADGTTWNNEHLFKGLHRSFPGANVTRPVPAVTAACMMVDRQLFADMGGLSTAYVQGDYEDSDFCLRLARSGKETWYLPSVELYHLEGQSYPSVLRAQTTGYNQWLHTHLWDEDIEAIAAAWEAAPPGQVPAAPPAVRRNRPATPRAPKAPVTAQS
ncbi:MAG: hypothetical protein AVDCRST_MAG20-2685 [uncultured Acidimicrobiales bacterium]|uniref:Glycosyltransferase 2-like domain-containing protein n=1 Tax=uncultured Acidimicrobiales bacterium TaxID=310071 RepID=A0A6J4IUX3_9ACTN|nr:MAG: hypothetical protein AVDCRST_MAG20-2685 [uncultured Acidimicrobiales bacterium]